MTKKIKEESTIILKCTDMLDIPKPTDKFIKNYKIIRSMGY